MSDYELTDSDYDYDENEKILLKNATKRQEEESEEEVFNVQSSGEDTDDSFKNDIEDYEDELPSSKAWGKRKRDYYNTDYVDPDYGGFQGKDGSRAEYEEQEARAIQERLLKEIDESDYILDSFKQVQSTVEEEKGEEKIEVDISGLSKREKLALFAKESPEFAGLVEDFKVKIEECDKKLLPILNLVEKKEIPNLAICKFIQMKYDLSMNYCTNIMYYLLLKSQRVPVQSHPVIKRIVEHRQLLNKLEKLSKKVHRQIDIVLEKVEKGEKLKFVEDETERQYFKSSNRKKNVTDSKFYNKQNESGMDGEEDMVTEEEKEEKEEEGDEGLEDFDDDDDDDNESDDADNLLSKEDKEFIKNLENEDNNDDDDDNQDESVGVSKGDESDAAEQRRSITYQIAKNKGLTPHRKKENRNPRVKYRNKFVKAKKRRKGQVREPRSELQRYSGEISGIKIGISRSTKLK